MTEDESGHVKVTEEQALMQLDILTFFIKLLVFQERMDKRIAETKKLNGKTNP